MHRSLRACARVGFLAMALLLSGCGSAYKVTVANSQAKVLKRSDLEFRFTAVAWSDDHADVTLKIRNRSRLEVAHYDTRQIRFVSRGTQWDVGEWWAQCKLQPRRQYIRIHLLEGHTLLVKHWSRNEVSAELRVPRGEGQHRDEFEVDFGSIEFEGSDLEIGRVTFTR
ncbi:MAG: hypothetical protein JSW67_07980 [Candidatus Latescibacterota bacterium]|nr:MAG: hypothetical protein JSW67_07980 [Candidatus Latescibacterota bacterium]